MPDPGARLVRMRSEDVVTTSRCNQACCYCTVRRSEDPPGFADRNAVAARIRASIDRGGERIVLTGGEPTLRGDLPALVSFAKRAGAREVWLETNGTILDARRVAALRKAGLDGVRLQLSGFSGAVDAVTRDPGGFEAAKRGLACSIGTGLFAEVASVLSRSTLELVAAMPVPLRSFLKDHGAIRCWWLAVVSSVPDESEWPEAPALLSTIEDVVRGAREADLPVKLDARSAPPPCLFSRPGRVASAFALSPGGRQHPQFARFEACATCLLADRCPGVHRAQRRIFEGIEPAPVRDQRLRRRMTMIGTVAEQMQRELVEPGTFRDGRGGRFEEAIIRFNFRCNQRCGFCFVSTHLPDPPESRVREAIEEAGRRGARIVISGGEPTLNASFLPLARFAAERSAHPVQLQTNAMAFAEGDLARRLVEVGVREAFVSLHASCARVSDVVTGAPGTFEATCRGVDRLVEAGVEVTLNFVLFRSNLDELVPWVRMAAGRWPGVRLNLSFVAPSTDVVPHDVETVPRYSEVLPAIERALVEAGELGVELGGFESMCGLPLCLVPRGLGSVVRLTDVPPGFDRGEFVKPPACDGCVLRSRCFGVRRGYVALHGDAELRPIGST